MDQNNKFVFLQENNFVDSVIQFIPKEEIFVKITQKIVPYVKDYYYISNYGNLYSSYK